MACASSLPVRSTPILRRRLGWIARPPSISRVSVHKSSGLETVKFGRTPRLGRIITASSKASSMWCAEERACAGAKGLNSRPKLGPGDFIYVPPFVPHQEINASRSEPLECVLVRSDKEAVVVNLDIEPVEKPDEVLWVDPIHRGRVVLLERQD